MLRNVKFYWSMSEKNIIIFLLLLQEIARKLSFPFGVIFTKATFKNIKR